MSTKIVKLEDLSKALTGFGNVSLEKQRKAVASGMLQSIPDLVNDSPVDTGLYAQSWSFTSLEKSAILGNTAPHAPIIERGARPFVPPIGPLLRWAKRVLQDPSQPPNFSSEVWALAKGTQNKIAKEGMQPRHVLERNIPMIIENIKKELNRVEL